MKHIQPRADMTAAFDAQITALVAAYGMPFVLGRIEAIASERYATARSVSGRRAWEGCVYSLAEAVNATLNLPDGKPAEA